MSLATRCLSCGTVFRVVEDQLKISEGWVRCGRCEEVFNARQSLFDLERGAPPAWPGEAVAQAPVQRESGVWPAARVDEQVVHTIDGASPADPTPADPAADEAAIDGSLLPLAAPLAPSSPAEHAELPGVAATAGDAPAAADPAPHFLRRAERAARWRRPRVVVGLTALSLALTALLLAQLGMQWRDALSARWPAARPTLQALCAVGGCRIEPLRRLESLAVDSSGLSQIDGGQRYRLSVVLRNRDTVEILLPDFDLTLTDTQGRTLARKVLRPAELGATQPSLAAAGELALQALLEPGPEAPAGYTVEIFYP